MEVLADLHIHSKYSRATSRKMDVRGIARYAKLKGIALIGTGDFTHPLWLKELKNHLLPLENGLFEFDEVIFLLSAEVSCVFTQGGIKKIHIIIFAPNFEVVEQINNALAGKGSLTADGRPTFGIRASELVEIVMGISKKCLLIPSHAWTPWFSIFGANSGFDSVKECFEDMAKHIYALETGLSSDPPMNWRLSTLDKYTLISNSDAHSPQKIGREANLFEIDKLSYEEIISAIKDKEKRKLKLTLEFFPEEGKYHFDGHRVCGVCFSPSETKKHKYICPVCKRKLTIGVLHRVEELADREEGFVPKNSVPYKHIIPLNEIIANAYGLEVGSKKVEMEYNKLINGMGNEYKVLMSNYEQLCKLTSKRIAEGITLVQKGKIKVSPGYDGVYGKVRIFENEDEEKKEEKQKSLYEFLK